MKLDSAEKISQALKRFAITQSEFTKKTGLSFVHVTRILRGDFPLDGDRLETFAHIAVKMISERLTEGILDLQEERRQIEQDIKDLQEAGKAFWSDFMQDEEESLGEDS